MAAISSIHSQPCCQCRLQATFYRRRPGVVVLILAHQDHLSCGAFVQIVLVITGMLGSVSGSYASHFYCAIFMFMHRFCVFRVTFSCDFAYLSQVEARICRLKKCCCYQSGSLPHFFVVDGPPSLLEPSSLKKASSIRASLQLIIFSACFLELSIIKPPTIISSNMKYAWWKLKIKSSSHTLLKQRSSTSTKWWMMSRTISSLSDYSTQHAKYNDAYLLTKRDKS